MSYLQIDTLAFDLLSPSSSQVSLEAIVRSLFRIPRFSGHTSRPWTVGDHSIAVCQYLTLRGATQPARLLGLLHDAHEAYIGDIPSPLKTLLRFNGKSWHTFEDAIAHTVQQALIPPEVWPTDEDRTLVRNADLALLEIERREFLPLCEKPWGLPHLEISPEEGALVLRQHPHTTFKQLYFHLT